MYMLGNNGRQVWAALVGTDRGGPSLPYLLAVTAITLHVATTHLVIILFSLFS